MPCAAGTVGDDGDIPVVGCVMVNDEVIAATADVGMRAATFYGRDDAAQGPASV